MAIITRPGKLHDEKEQEQETLCATGEGSLSLEPNMSFAFPPKGGKPEITNQPAGVQVTRQNSTIVVTVIFCWMCTGALAQQQTPTAAQEKPATKIEAISIEKGAVLIKGIESIAKISGSTGNVELKALSLTNVKTRQTTYGVTLHLTELGRIGRDGTYFVDSDELDDFSRALIYLGGVDKSVSPFSNFEVEYHTRGDVSVAAFSTGTGTDLEISGGRIGAINVFFDLGKVKELRDAIDQAKAKITSATAAQK